MSPQAVARPKQVGRESLRSDGMGQAEATQQGKLRLGSKHGGDPDPDEEISEWKEEEDDDDRNGDGDFDDDDGDD